MSGEMNLTYKTVTASEVDSLLAMMREFYAHERLPFDEAIARRALDGLIHHDAFGRVWLVELDGETAGYVVLTLGYSLEFHGRDAFVDELFIKPLHRGRGVGTESLRFVETQCRALGVAALHLEVDHENFKAQSVYRQFGFADQGRYLMTKWLDE